MAESKVEVKIAEVTGMPGKRGRKSAAILPESTAVAEGVLAGKQLKVTGTTADKVIRQARQLIADANNGQRLASYTTDDGSTVVYAKAAK